MWKWTDDNEELIDDETGEKIIHLHYLNPDDAVLSVNAKHKDKIAAAPELLEAAKAAYIWLSNFQPYIPIWTSNSDQELREQLRAAIARAKGVNA